MSEPADPSHRHLPKVVSLNLVHLRRDLAAIDGFNAKFALLLTRAVGTMWCFWVFNGIAVVSLPTAIRTGNPTVLINWVSSNWMQLILLPAVMVGQNLQAVTGDARQQVLGQHMDLVVDRLDTRTEGGITDILRRVAALDSQVCDLAGVVREVMAQRAGHDAAVAADAKRAATAAESAFVATQVLASQATGPRPAVPADPGVPPDRM